MYILILLPVFCMSEPLNKVSSPTGVKTSHVAIYLYNYSKVNGGSLRKLHWCKSTPRVTVGFVGVKSPLETLDNAGVKSPLELLYITLHTHL